MRSTGTVIIGAGQAGLALSWALTRAGLDHVVLDRGRVGERWRSERWDSLALLTPNWANRLPGDEEPADPDAFQGRAGFVATLERYARSFGSPVRTSTNVCAVERRGRHFRVLTDRGDWETRSVVVATGHCDHPALPPVADEAPRDLARLHASCYRAPERLPDGGVLVVGSGASGHQIAYELAAAGRDVVLATGRHARILRRYRGRDMWSWLQEIGHLERTVDDLAQPPWRRPAPSLPLDGRAGGRQLDLGVLADAGVSVAGRLIGFHGRRAEFGGDLQDEVLDAERRLRGLLHRIDEHVEDVGATVPAAEPLTPIALPPAPDTLDLDEHGIAAIVWATGFRRRHAFLRIPVERLDGEIAHRRGLTSVPGLYVLGQAWQHRMTSHQIGGVGRDALHIAAHINRRERLSRAWAS